MATTDDIKPGDGVWLLAYVDSRSTEHDEDGGASFFASVAYGWHAADADTVGDPYLSNPPMMRDHPALPKLAALLASDGPALAAAIAKAVELINRESFQVAHDFNRWKAGESDVLDAQEALLRQLAAALEGTDGNKTN